MTPAQGLNHCSHASACHAQVHVKLSAFFRVSKQPWPYMEARPAIRKLVDTFGADRCMWGTDFPFVNSDGCGYVLAPPAEPLFEAKSACCHDEIVNGSDSLLQQEPAVAEIDTFPHFRSRFWHESTYDHMRHVHVAKLKDLL